MEWLEMSFHTTHETSDLVSDIFIEAGSKGVLLEDSKTFTEVHQDHYGEIYQLNKEDYPKSGIVVKGYLPVTTCIENQIENIQAKLLNLKLSQTFESRLEIKTLKEEDWANSWKQYYHPIKITEKLLIKPSWLPISNDSNKVEILLDPGMAFGSGTHETTRLCLELIEKYVDDKQIVVDVGTGTGILAIAASKLGAKFVYAVDLDEMAVVRAKENTVLNRCQNLMIENNHLINGVGALTEAPTLIVANILAPIIIDMLEQVKKVLLPNKLFICSGIVHHEKESVLAALELNQFKVIEIKEKNGWLGIVSSSSRACES